MPSNRRFGIPKLRLNRPQRSFTSQSIKLQIHFFAHLNVLLASSRLPSRCRHSCAAMGMCVTRLLTYRPTTVQQSVHIHVLMIHRRGKRGLTHNIIINMVMETTTKSQFIRDLL